MRHGGGEVLVQQASTHLLIHTRSCTCLVTIFHSSCTTSARYLVQASMRAAKDVVPQSTCASCNLQAVQLTTNEDLQGFVMSSLMFPLSKNLLWLSSDCCTAGMRTMHCLIEVVLQHVLAHHMQTPECSFFRSQAQQPASQKIHALAVSYACIVACVCMQQAPQCIDRFRGESWLCKCSMKVFRNLVTRALHSQSIVSLRWQQACCRIIATVSMDCELMALGKHT